MKNQPNRKQLLRYAGFFLTVLVFLSLVSFSAYSQTTNPPKETTPPANQVPRTLPETQPAPSQSYPGSKHMGKDTVKHAKKETPTAKPDTVKKTPPPRVTQEYYEMTE